ncbi:hypothetical protein MYSEV_052 [Mythimna separata entomopoxvirus 'L']|uniref:Uncharacterized protein n=1 Tax=Mythimna separata entomopoxvirus 'L' TaxID=1293572 RepID=A0A916KQ95_9POXV|nr:hypothetical protein MYSEV_052 [Mythimna separata entomopoxvirus 'L']CCU56250.1 hypothetical protein MYSEV_052 [Mythimna separata entomopoxvirus 'L']
MMELSSICINFIIENYIPMSYILINIDIKHLLKKYNKSKNKLLKYYDKFMYDEFIDFINNYIPNNYINDVSKLKIDTIDKFSNKIDLFNINYNDINLNSYFLEKYKDKLNWNTISIYNKFKLQNIDKYIDCINFRYLLENDSVKPNGLLTLIIKHNKGLGMIDLLIRKKNYLFLKLMK